MYNFVQFKVVANNAFAMYAVIRSEDFLIASGKY